MRVMVTRHCRTCDNEWKAPSDKGKCPACHGDNVINVNVQNNGLKRV